MTRVLLFLAFIFTITSCTDPIDNNTTKDPDPITPDLEETVTGSVLGFLVDEAGEPIVFATVTAGNKYATTDNYGYFTISNTSLSKFAAHVKAEGNGYFTAHSTFTPRAGKENFVRITLVEKPEPATLDAAGGGTVQIQGARILLQQNSVVTESGAAYSGDVKIYARLLHPNETGAQPGLPGDGRGVDKDGHAKMLQSFSPMAIELTSPGGQPLQLADGKPATLTMPIASSRLADAPNDIELWNYNTSTGLWEEAGTAFKDGNNYMAVVEHFSFWDGAIGVSMVNVTAKVVNDANQPLAHVPVRVTLAGYPLNAGYGSFGFTDESGAITGAVYANRDFTLDVLTPCSTIAYTHEFSAASSDVDLGTLTGNMGQGSVVLTGRAENCDGQAISNGYIQTYDGGFFNRIPITNGTFSFSGVMCTNTSVSIVAVDLSNNKQSEPKELNLVTGANDAGTLSVCATSTMGHITYKFDGVEVTIQEPTDTIAAYYFDAGTGGVQIVTLSGEPNTDPKMSLQLAGDPGSGTMTFTDIFTSAFPSGRGYWPVAVNVNITESGAAGGFISGEFSSTMLDFADNSIHTLECSFRVRRYR